VLHLLLVFQEKIACYESEYPFLKESATILELALWKVNINELSPKNDMENTDTRKQYRVSCGAGLSLHMCSRFFCSHERLYIVKKTQ
jgi:hypothetical protein